MKMVDFVIGKLGIKDDTRTNINTLEPTIGIGNLFEGLLKLKNNEHMFIE